MDGVIVLCLNSAVSDTEVGADAAVCAIVSDTDLGGSKNYSSEAL